jgi:hypothetical protein
VSNGEDSTITGGLQGASMIKVDSNISIISKAHALAFFKVDPFCNPKLA